jgi:acyl CoA:acetate/3-ketoacid CoA transferase beta subunit
LATERASSGGEGQSASGIRATEIMAVAGASELHDGEVVVVGLGLPWVACALARRTHAPSLTSVMEIGVINGSPVDTPVGLADSRIFHQSTCWSSFLDTLGMNLHRGLVDVGFLGALEVDCFGNINTTLLKGEEGKVTYVNGSAGGNDVASLARRVMIIMRHEKRKLPRVLAHLTSPGFVDGRDRRETCLRGEGPHRIITDMAILGFDPDSHRATLLSAHPGVSVEHIVENTGFELLVPSQVATTPLPDQEQLHILRREIDPRGAYLN